MRSRGIFWIEMFVVTVIIGILAAITVPLFFKRGDPHRAVEFAEKMHGLKDVRILETFSVIGSRQTGCREGISHKATGFNQQQERVMFYVCEHIGTGTMTLRQ